MVDAALRKELLRNDEGWLSEETADDLSRLDRSRVWIVDPLDGTREFVKGIPEFCISIAMVEDSQPIAGGICNPATRETFIGSLQSGVTYNGKPASPSQRTKPNRRWGRADLGGEIFTTPGEVNGTFVIDGVVGDYLCTKFGDLRSTPLTVEVKRNRLVAAHSSNKELKDDFWAYTHTDENSDRVGEFAIGTNIELKDVIGQILQDEKFPGVHIAFGNPYGAHTGADWFSSTHIDVVGRKFDIWADDEQIMKDGKFLIEA